MKIVFIYWIFPVLVVYSDRFFRRDDPDGRCYPVPFVPVVQIRSECKGNRLLLEHELEHRRQLWRMLWLHTLAYLLSKEFRYELEIEAYRRQAYRAQMEVDPDGVNLHVKYGARVILKYHAYGQTYEEILARLTEENP